MNKIIGVIIYTIIILNLVGGIVFFYNPIQNPPSQNTNQNNINTTLNNSNSVQNIPSNSNNKTTTTNNQNTNSGKIKESELSNHDKETDCWISYEGKVYDITSFLPKHPGSAQAIIPYCGTSSEFENAFSDQHGKSQVKKLIEEGKYKGELE